MIIDSHVHIYPPEVIKDWEKIAQKEPYFKLLASGKVHKWATAEDLIEKMDKSGISKSWVTTFAFRDQGLCAYCNDYLIEAVNRYKGRLEGFCVLNPVRRGFEDEIARCKKAGMLGVGELFPDGQVFDVTDFRQTWRLAEACFDNHMVLLLHTAEQVGHDYPGKGNTGPKEAAQFCMNHPEVKVIFAHLGGGLWQYELMPEMRVSLQNARYDTAALPFLYDNKIFAAMKAAGVIDKVLYGSDFPLLSVERYMKLMDTSGLDDEAKKAILGQNAVSFVDGLLDFTNTAST